MYKTIIFTFLLSMNIYSNTLLNPTSLSKDLYPQSILSGNYEDNIDNPSTFLDFNYGERVASPEQITLALNKWSQQSNKLKVVEYAKTHEGRPLHAVFISSSENLNNLDNIKNKISKLSDARNTSNITPASWGKIFKRARFCLHESLDNKVHEMIIVAHRLTTLSKCSKILEIERGKILRTTEEKLLLQLDWAIRLK